MKIFTKRLLFIAWCVSDFVKFKEPLVDESETIHIWFYHKPSMNVARITQQFHITGSLQTWNTHLQVAYAWRIVFDLLR